jgi:LPXTG-motif cell wall-anchored protein
MKKYLILGLAVAMILGTAGVQAKAADSVQVSVTIANGTLELAQEKITVTDLDGDGVYTIDEALYCAHEAKYTGGAAEGYGTASGDYGLYITKLWGVENASGFGYYVNDESAMGLTDTVKDGDRVNAFVYTDTTYFSDTYCYFDVVRTTVTEKEALELTLSAAGYDANWSPVVLPVQGAVILIDGVESSYTTDAEGKVTVSINSQAGTTCVISAVSALQTLVPPVSIVTVEAELPKTGDSAVIYLILAAALTAASVAAGTVVRRRKAV